VLLGDTGGEGLDEIVETAFESLALVHMPDPLWAA
jgi:hypothetical protein